MSDQPGVNLKYVFAVARIHGPTAREFFPRRGAAALDIGETRVDHVFSVREIAGTRIGIEVLHHGCHSFLDVAEFAALVAAFFHSKPAIVVGIGLNGCPVVKSEPSGLDYGLAEGDIATDAIALADIVERFGNLALELGVMAAHIFIHIIDIYLGFPENRGFGF